MSIAHRSDRFTCALTLATFALASSLSILLTPRLAHAAVVVHSVDATLSGSTLFATGDRRLNALAFHGSTTAWTGDNFLTFAAGSLATVQSAQGLQPPTDWLLPAPRDVTQAASLYSVNPDRADHSTPFAEESSHSATLAEVFSAFTHTPAVAPYKNMSYILDGETVDRRDSQFLTLLFPAGQILSADNNPETVELAWLERGGNSDIIVQGILDFVGDAPILTTPLKLMHTDAQPVGWALNTLEIPAAQPVFGLGVSLDPAWQNLRGFQFSSFPGANGPDTVAVGTAFTQPQSLTPIPEPTTASLIFAATVAASLRRRRSAPADDRSYAVHI